MNAYKITNYGLINKGEDPRLDKRPSKNGITLNAVLDVLSSYNYPVSIKTLSKELHEDPESIRSLVQTLEKKHYIESVSPYGTGVKDSPKEIVNLSTVIKSTSW